MVARRRKRLAVRASVPRGHPCWASAEPKRAGRLSIIVATNGKCNCWEYQRYRFPHHRPGIHCDQQSPERLGRCGPPLRFSGTHTGGSDRPFDQPLVSPTSRAKSMLARASLPIHLRRNCPTSAAVFMGRVVSVREFEYVMTVSGAPHRSYSDRVRSLQGMEGAILRDHVPYNTPIGCKLRVPFRRRRNIRRLLQRWFDG